MGTQSSRMTMGTIKIMSSKFYWIISVLGLLLVLASFVFVIIEFHKTNERMNRIEEGIRVHDADTLMNSNAFMLPKVFSNNLLQDSAVYMHPSEIRNFVTESTQQVYNTFVASASVLLAIVSIVITIVVIVIPILLNNNLQKTNELWYKRKHKEAIKKMKAEMDKKLIKMKEEMDVELKDSIYRGNEEFYRKTEELIGQLKNALHNIEKEIDKLKKVAIDDIKKTKFGNTEEQFKGKDGIDEQINGYDVLIEKALDDVPAEVYFNLGKLCKEKGDLNKAKDCLEKAIGKMPKYVEAYQELAEVFMALTDVDSGETSKTYNLRKAWEAIEKAMGLKDNNNEINLIETRCKIFIVMRKYEAAFRDVDEYIKLANEKGLVRQGRNGEKIKEEIDRMRKEEAQSGEIEKITIKNQTLLMKKVAGGAFIMGATNSDREAIERERPAHSVLLDDFYISETVVTQALWESVMGKNPSVFVARDHPVESMSWNDCQEFIIRLNRMTGRNFQLPTEAQWEFAARGGNKSKGYKYSGSDSLDSVAWYWKNSGLRPIEGTDEDWNIDKIKGNKCKTHSVKTKKPNELGLYDMTGNVWEWCCDWFESYSVDPQINPTGAKEGQYRVVRGGSWNSEARHCRVLRRSYNNPEDGRDYLGFRLVLVP